MTDWYDTLRSSPAYTQPLDQMGWDGINEEEDPADIFLNGVIEVLRHLDPVYEEEEQRAKRHIRERESSWTG